MARWQRGTVVAVVVAALAVVATWTLLATGPEFPTDRPPQPRSDSYEGTSGMGADGFGGFLPTPDPVPAPQAP